MNALTFVSFDWWITRIPRSRICGFSLRAPDCPAKLTIVSFIYVETDRPLRKLPSKHACDWC